VYRPIQNEEAFNFLDSLAAERRIRFHTAGVIGKGERMWILAQIPGDITIPKTEDVIKRFLLFSNSHDGTSAARVFSTPIRVVCANTLNQAMRGAKGEGITLRHTHGLDSKVQEAQRVLGLAVRAYDDMKGQIFAAAKFKLSAAQRAAYFDSLFGSGRKRRTDEDGEPAEGTAEPEEVHGRTQKTLAKLDQLAESGKGNDAKGIRGSAWAAYNAVTEYIDHGRSGRVSAGADAKSKRLESIWFGQGAKIKEDAWENMVALLN
jgi:phage/plasmid-like protein (TIGR03299 family)